MDPHHGAGAICQVFLYLIRSYPALRTRGLEPAPIGITPKRHLLTPTSSRCHWIAPNDGSELNSYSMLSRIDIQNTSLSSAHSVNYRVCPTRLKRAEIETKVVQLSVSLEWWRDQDQSLSYG